MALPRLFEHIFFCAPDLDPSALEPGQPLAHVHELARGVSVYFNRGDAAVVVADYTRGVPDRLGTVGSARPRLLSYNVHQIDCSPIVHGLVEHSYFLAGHIVSDIRQSIAGLPAGDPHRRRISVGDTTNQWAMRWE